MFQVCAIGYVFAWKGMANIENIMLPPSRAILMFPL